MSSIFLVFNEADAGSAATVRQALEASGYRVTQPPTNISPASVLYPRAIDTAVLGSAAVVALWSAEAARDEWVERALLVAGRLAKPVVVVPLDASPLPPAPASPFAVSPLEAVTGCLPAPDADAPLLAVAELLAHEHIRERRKGIEQARDLLAHPDYGEVVRAWLEYIARHDLTEAMCELAQSVLDAHAGRRAQPPRPDAARFRIGVRCPKGHVTWYDKRRLCSDHTTFKREIARRGDAELSVIIAPCDEPGCEETTKVTLDCEEYA